LIQHLTSAGSFGHAPVTVKPLLSLARSISARDVFYRLTSATFADFLARSSFSPGTTDIADRCENEGNEK